MSKQAFIFEVSDSSFEKYVIGNSDKVPVFVAFISVWSEPCILLTDMFADLAKEFAEAINSILSHRSISQLFPE